MEVARIGAGGEGFQYLARELAGFSKSVSEDIQELGRHPTLFVFLKIFILPDLTAVFLMIIFIRSENGWGHSWPRSIRRKPIL